MSEFEEQLLQALDNIATQLAEIDKTLVNISESMEN